MNVEDVLAELAEVTEALRRRDQLIAQAREAGATWEQITHATGMSRPGAIKAAERAHDGVVVTLRHREN